MEITLEEFNEIKVKETELSLQLDMNAITEQQYNEEVNKIKEKLKKSTNFTRFPSKKKFMEFIKANMKNYEEELKEIEHEAYHAEAMKNYGINFYFCVLVDNKDKKANPLIKIEPNQIKIKKMDAIKRTIFNIEVLTAPYDMNTKDIYDLNVLLAKVKSYKKFTPQQKELLLDMAQKLADKEKPK